MKRPDFSMKWTNNMRNPGQTIDLKELAKFEKDAAQWWDESGPQKALHRFNLVRTSFVKHLLTTHFGKNSSVCYPLEGLRILDAGCGGGLLTEPLYRLGATVMGIDPVETAIQVAKSHADTFLLNIAYEVASIEILPTDQTYHSIIALEVLEHVNDPQLFLKECYRRLMPGGLLILSTLNRTVRSYIEGIIAAEYILKWVTPGTHQWKKFLKPSELHKALKQTGFMDVNFQGARYQPLKDEWLLSDSLDVNYFAHAIR